ncbi:MAG: NADH-quinone oxidoreductase subunit K [Ignavibacteria bacterium GWA2_55_11]|nr:MAG: NADH-quinone oxidoreductase subunit K [Ignavibacteria bacterium GWA2_55_11]OGU44072.1 MAG: NADH-quinone oxidoreductase subunit K [Ignavibacteria bacterium GWC2_56_12]OGU62455.1 MAG: NADH-quinone oxidoreductase subunit K [Ignavibacteria bacterium RIFCSPHIGHO2_02_FULL_56_12]OGU73892.1 MAG: NADH-quinone oxidoreductase subunit K [Ignavibacteria bacterium RIFCSPLOWO2_12_FULL_56_21]OGU75610.1 MAG: NADH-quinone oxidoreductase subunit K [Ignavibacteria bacterium RIFCSPLOWO2_02_FULL_55_14]HAV24
MVPIPYYLVLSAAMFMIGAVGVLTRRNAIIVFMSIELMLNSVNLTLVAFSVATGTITGQVLVFFVMTVAAAEAAVGLAIIIALYRRKQTVNLDEINILKW